MDPLRPVHRYSDDTFLFALKLTHFTAACSLGCGTRDIYEALRAERSGLEPCTFEGTALPTFLGEAPGLSSVRLGKGLEHFDSRSNRLLELAIRQDDFEGHVAAAVERYGEKRIGVFIGTSSSGMREAEKAYSSRNQHDGSLPDTFDYRRTLNFYSGADYVRERLNLRGPSAAVTCACTSSAKAFATARRLMKAGLLDAAVVGGVDALCLTSIYGFQSLQLCSSRPCRPFDRTRDGLSLGESAAILLLEPLTEARRGDILLSGIGESSDAYHLAMPHPEGLGAQLAMLDALKDASLTPADIDYVNLHGTATPNNDKAESKAIIAALGPGTVCNSTKGATGHTLGACGALESVISVLALTHRMIPAGLPTEDVEWKECLDYVLRARSADLEHVLSNSFGFGGTNCSLLWSRVA